MNDTLKNGVVKMSEKDDMVYLLSMTFHGRNGMGELWLTDDEDVIAPTSKMGWARPFDSENAAREYRNEQNMNTSWQITPITGARYFKAKLAGGSR